MKEVMKQITRSQMKACLCAQCPIAVACHERYDANDADDSSYHMIADTDGIFLTGRPRSR